ncbi:MAG: F0F1 ATP synthase subunit A [Candidatus Moranbacteria bacterium]|nr:F0F1 ATP synthase subunit A [Candidatus Moranbacteria bacterium]
MHISLVPETLTKISGFAITNTLITSWLVMALLIITAYFVGRKPKMMPGKAQNLAEYVIETLLSFFEGVWGNKEKVQRFFAFLATFFIFILLCNWFGLIPGVGTVGIYEEVHGKREFLPLLRSLNSDLNATVAWAIISVITTQIAGIVFLGVGKHLGKFFNFKSPIDFFVGILELISEVSKIISFSFRLFGNVFAGEVLLMVMMFLVPYILPLPFFMLEMFVGLIQALVFTTLTLVFLKMATEAHE